ncbi:MAG TPA: alpha-amylase family glycosyl hydrolase [Alphaproteobacteria bacterium]|nr:hypothetical protein [Rhodospirillaceae bacterium]HRJ11661.1 alpha-amylase family glycosyl hydrolase [Alphaproteobacteria bacterium]
MAGLILYSVNPRSLGVLPQWTTAINEAERLECNCIHLNPFHPTTQTGKIKDGAQQSGSLYAITDHFAINPEFCEQDAVVSKTQLHDFIRNAHGRKLRVMADLVLGHVAIDHPLVKSNPEFFRRNADGTLYIGGPVDDPWSDVATIDYENPAAWNYFLGEQGYWLRLMDYYLDLGFNAFRCDAVYWLPQLVWEQVLNYAHRRNPDIIILAETLGLSGQDAELMQEALREVDSRIIYDLAYDDVGRNWDGKDATTLNQGRAGRVDCVSHFGTLGFVDSHDFAPRAKLLRDVYKDTREATADIKIAMQCLRDYAVACFTNNSVLIPRGFQWCIESNTGVFRQQVTPEFFQQLKADRRAVPTALNIGPALAEMHELRGKIPHDARVRVSNAVVTDSPYLAAIQCDFHNHDDDRVLASIILLLNTAMQHGAQKFPETWWRGLKEAQSNAQRIQFGPDMKNRAGITGVAILVVPGDHMQRMALNQRQAPAAKPGDELNLVA